MAGRCPTCRKEPHVIAEAVRVRGGGAGHTWPAVLFMCDKCEAILSVSLDPDWQAELVAGQLRMVRDITLQK